MAHETGDPMNAAVVDAMKAALMQDVDAKISEKVDELWQKGSRMVEKVQKRQEEHAERLSTAIAGCLEKQRSLEQDNEQLKQALDALTRQLACLNLPGGNGAAVSPRGGAPGLLASPAAVGAQAVVTPPGDRQRSARRSQQHELASPASSSSAAGAESAAPMPEIPAFPFPAATAAQPAASPGGGGSGGPPLSLMEALGHSPLGQAPPRQPPKALSLADSLLPSVDVFTFTLRKDDDTHLGLSVSHHEKDKVLCVEGVLPEGAVDAWNRQCMSGHFPEKAVMVGDRIVKVNAISYEPAQMLEECKEKLLLSLTICRGVGPLPDLPQGADSKPAAKPTALRAGASEFVPGAASAWLESAAASAAAAGIEEASAEAAEAAVAAAAAVFEETEL